MFHTVAQKGIPVGSSMLLANPIPEDHSIPKDEMEHIIARAIQDAEVAKSTGSDNTPFILNRIRELSNGRSVTANCALIESNVARAAKLAVALAELTQNRKKQVYQQQQDEKPGLSAER